MGAENLDWKGWTVIATLICAFLIMGSDKVGPDLVFTCLLSFYTAAGILTVSKAAAGYSNTGLLTVIFLYLVAEGIYQTGALEKVIGHCLGRSRSVFWALVRMMIPCMFLSAFLNNTPVVALLVPILISWARRSGVPPKKVLMPLSIASVLGGTCTLIGTSTNLVVSGQQAARYEKLKRYDDVQFKIFDIAPYGVPYAVWGFMFVIIMQKWLLPGNASRFCADLLFALRVHSSSPARNKTLLEAGLNSAHGVKVVAVVKHGVWIKSPMPSCLLEEGDVIYVAGELDHVDHCAEELGMQFVNFESEVLGAPPPEIDATHSPTGYNRLLQVTVSATSPIIGCTLSTARLTERFGTTVVGRARAGRPDGRLSDILLRAGDILILDASVSADLHTTEFLSTFTDIHVIKEGLAKEFLLAFDVTTKDVGGRTVTEAGLRGIPGIAVVGLDRQGDPKQRICPVDHTTIIELGDVLWAACDLEGSVFLSKFVGLSLREQPQIEKTTTNILYRTLATAAISTSSALVGKTLGQLRFRQKYDAAVVGVHREGTRFPISPSDMVIQGSDILLLSVGPEFLDTHKHDRNFVMLNAVANSDPPKRNRAELALFLGTAMVLTQVIPGIIADKKLPEWIHLWPCSVLTAGLMILSGCLSGDQARRSILWDVYLAIAGAFGVSAAMETTGVANEFARVFVSIADSVGGRGAGLTAIYVATALLSEILTNNASGAIMFPIAAVAGDQLGIEPRAMSVAIMLGASAGFINPFSYQCNMMVYAAGNYRTIEFVKFGVPFQTYLLVVAAFILFFYDQWKTVWIISFVVCGAVIGVPLIWAIVPDRITVGVEMKVSSFFKKLWSKITRKSAAEDDSMGAGDGGAVDGVESSSSSVAGDDACKELALVASLASTVQVQMTDISKPKANDNGASTSSGGARSSGDDKFGGIRPA